MAPRMRAATLALFAPLLLLGCGVVPGKFVSTLTILADRRFAFSYQGEVYSIDPGGQLTSGDATILRADAKAEPDSADAAKGEAAKKAEAERKNAEIAAMLRKETGYRKVDYLGDGKFMVDYAITGKLTHGFVYPFNSDAEIVFPFIAIELRGRDIIRMKAPAFAARAVDKTGPMDQGGNDKLDGIFTLITDAAIVSQNNEDGARPAGGGRKAIT